jgi:hypothetical protein
MGFPTTILTPSWRRGKDGETKALTDLEHLLHRLTAVLFPAGALQLLAGLYRRQGGGLLVALAKALQVDKALVKQLALHVLTGLEIGLALGHAELGHGFGLALEIGFTGFFGRSLERMAALAATRVIARGWPTGLGDHRQGGTEQGGQGQGQGATGRLGSHGRSWQGMETSSS